MSIAPFYSLITSSIPAALSVWRLEEAPSALPIKVPAVPAISKPATARVLNPGCYAVSISRSGAAYAEC